MSRDLSSRFKYGVSIMAIAAILPFSIQASSAQQADEYTELEEVVVTGSRIKRSGLDNPQPSIVITAEEFDKRAFVNIADLLNEVPAFGSPAASPNGDQSVQIVGQNVVDFLGLGSQRTLVIVNGRRFVSSNAPTNVRGGSVPGLQVDFNTIPIALIERVETIAIGGAPIYGSDAIAGTINVFLKDDYEGVDISGRYSVSERGDGQEYQIQAVMGGNFADDRGNVAISVEFNTQDLLPIKARRFLALDEPFIVEQTDLVDADGDGELDDVFTIHKNQMVQLFTNGGLASSGRVVLPSIGVGTLGSGGFFQFDPNGNLVDFIPGTNPGGSLFFAEGGDGSDLFDDVGTIKTPLERINVGGLGHYDIKDNVTAFMEFTFSNTRGEDFANQSGFQTFVFGNGSQAINASVSNPFLNSQARGVLAGLGLADDDTFFVSRLNNDILDDGRSTIDSTTYRIVTGLKGDFSTMDREFTWEVSANFGSSDIDVSVATLNDDRFFNALDAVALTSANAGDLLAGSQIIRDGKVVTIGAAGAVGQVGDIVCQSVLDRDQGNLSPNSGSGLAKTVFPAIDGCVAINIFGEDRALAEAISFVRAQNNTQTDIEQRVLSANMQGDLFDTWAGGIQFGIGFEGRKEDGLFRTSPLVQTGLTRFSTGVDNGGSFSTQEFYGELLIPLIAPEMSFGEGLFGETLINSLTFEPAARLVSTSIGGSSQSNWTFTLLARAQIMNDVTVRGNFTQSIRTPALVELFTPESNAFTFADDPCDDRFIDEGPNPAVRRANCESIGLGQTPFTSDIVNRTLLGKTAGNPDLTAEEAEAWTFGIGYSPRFIPGLVVSVDYLNIQINDRITALNLSVMMSQCFDDVNFQTTPDPICNNFTRFADGQVADFTTGVFNAAKSNFQGVTFDARYGVEVSDIAALVFADMADDDLGGLSWRLNGFRRIQNDIEVVKDVKPDPVIGSFGQPIWSLTSDVTYTKDAFRFFWRMAWQSTTKFSASGDNFLQDLDGNIVINTGTRAIHNVSFSYEFLDGFTGQLTINNALNRRPTLVQQAAADFGFAEQIGRSFVLSARASF